MATLKCYASSNYFPNSETKLPYSYPERALNLTSGQATCSSIKNSTNSYEIGFKFNLSDLPDNAIITQYTVGTYSSISGGRDYFTYDSFVGAIPKPYTSIDMLGTTVTELNNKASLADKAWILITAAPNDIGTYINTIDYAYITVTYTLGPSKIYRGDVLVNMTRRGDYPLKAYRGDYLL